MIRFLVCFVVALAVWGQGRLPKYEVFDTSGRTRIRIDSTSGMVFYDTGGVAKTTVTETNVSVAGTLTVGNYGNSIWPATDNTMDLGVGYQQWRSLHLGTSLVVNGTTRINSTGSGTFTNLDSLAWVNDFKPNTDDFYDLGSSSKRWKRGFFSSYVSVPAAGSLKVLDGGGNTSIEMTSTDFLARVPATATNGFKANYTGVYLTHNVSGIQTAYFAPDSGAGTGASIQLNTSAGASKFRILSANTDAPDALNGYKVNGSTVIDATSAATIGISSSGFNTTVGSYFTNGTTRINSSGDGTFRNLSFTGTGPYTFSSGVSLSGTSVTGSYTAGAGISIAGAVITNSVASAPTSTNATSPITASIAANVINISCSTCVTTTSLGTLTNDLIPNTDNFYNFGSASKRWREGRFAGPVYIGTYGSVDTVGSAAFYEVDSSTNLKTNGTTRLNSSGDATIRNLTMSGTLSGFPTSTSATCGAGEAVKSVSISSSGTLSVTCAVP